MTESAVTPTFGLTPGNNFSGKCALIDNDDYLAVASYSQHGRLGGVS